MPKKIEARLKAQARKKGFSKKRIGAYVYGALRKLGWRPSHQKKKKNSIIGGIRFVEN